MTEKVLVTGGSGFVGSQCVVQLLKRGYAVRTTVRSIAKKQDIRAMMKKGGLDAELDRLELVEAELLSDTNWGEAASGCRYVLHVASPIFFRPPRREDEMIKPAVEGALRVLRAARDAGARRVVMTSNFGAVGYSHNDRTRLITEESWTDPNEKGLSAYNKSKVLAEMAAWDFIRTQGGVLELATVNPTAIFGPALSPVLSPAYGLLQGVLDGSMRALPDIRMGVVDVRDVADLHLRAMENPVAAGQRFLAQSEGTMSLRDIVDLVRAERPDAAAKAPTRLMPTWVLRAAAPFSGRIRGFLPMIGVYRETSNEKARSILGWQPRSNAEAILASVDSLIEYGNLR